MQSNSPATVPPTPSPATAQSKPQTPVPGNNRFSGAPGTLPPGSPFALNPRIAFMLAAGASPAIGAPTRPATK
jgi:hypothetical protein